MLNKYRLAAGQEPVETFSCENLNKGISELEYDVKALQTINMENVDQVKRLFKDSKLITEIAQEQASIALESEGGKKGFISKVISFIVGIVKKVWNKIIGYLKMIGTFILKFVGIAEGIANDANSGEANVNQMVDQTVEEGEGFIAKGVTKSKALYARAVSLISWGYDKGSSLLQKRLQEKPEDVETVVTVMKDYRQVFKEMEERTKARVESEAVKNIKVEFPEKYWPYVSFNPSAEMFSVNQFKRTDDLLNGFYRTLEKLAVSVDYRKIEDIVNQAFNDVYGKDYINRVMNVKGHVHNAYTKEKYNRIVSKVNSEILKLIIDSNSLPKFNGNISTSNHGYISINPQTSYSAINKSISSSTHGVDLSKSIKAIFDIKRSKYNLNETHRYKADMRFDLSRISSYNVEAAKRLTDYANSNKNHEATFTKLKQGYEQYLKGVESAIKNINSNQLSTTTAITGKEELQLEIYAVCAESTRQLASTISTLESTYISLTKEVVDGIAGIQKAFREGSLRKVENE